MLKWLMLIVLAYVAYRWLFRVAATAPSKVGDGADFMVECAQCGLHFPQQEAVKRLDQAFCCEQHYLLWKQNH